MKALDHASTDGGSKLCDYSLEAVKSVKAAKGEDLRLTTFSSNGYPATGYGTKGFAPEGITDCATCVPEGSLVRIEVPEALQYEHGLMAVEDGVKDLVSLETQCTHHDAIRFSTGRCVKLQDLPLGTRATVLVLGDVMAPEDVSLADDLVTVAVT